jgi:amino acid transporter
MEVINLSIFIFILLSIITIITVSFTEYDKDKEKNKEKRDKALKITGIILGTIVLIGIIYIIYIEFKPVSNGLKERSFDIYFGPNDIVVKPNDELTGPYGLYSLPNGEVINPFVLTSSELQKPLPEKSSSPVIKMSPFNSEKSDIS